MHVPEIPDCFHYLPTLAPGVTAEGSPALPTTLTTCRKRRYLNTSLCYLWCASEGVSPYYLLPQVVRVVGSAGDPSTVTSAFEFLPAFARRVIASAASK